MSAKRPSHAELRAQGRAAERADVLAEIARSIAGVQRISKRNAEAGVDPGLDLTVYLARLRALQGTIEAGCHVGAGEIAELARTQPVTAAVAEVVRRVVVADGLPGAEFQGHNQ